jgi:hypothetical protein
MWLHQWPEDPATTDVKCYWWKPKLATVGTGIMVVKATDLPCLALQK